MESPRALPEETAAVSELEDAEKQQLEALVPCPMPAIQDRLRLNPPLARLPVELEVAIPVREFRVRNLVNLKPGEVIETQWEDMGDLPLAAGDVQLAWSEFEVVDARMAVRITRLA
jgi:flagellar motor switch/type III secretory pathway protein FliN